MRARKKKIFFFFVASHCLQIRTHVCVHRICFCVYLSVYLYVLPMSADALVNNL
ncbi:hypothetical protein C2G38_427025 [Gigaspora rosea]|uniref:Uncharacterized protein n=1 Tax=Gigaspora rosea TaxID=44941 RepID=A0A397VT04_9GLOM|nr:hypothetical protein C2G38_427025 [Gigaspora rosea]